MFSVAVVVVAVTALGMDCPLVSPFALPRPGEAASDEDNPLVLTIDAVTTAIRAAARMQSILIVSSFY